MLDALNSTSGMDFYRIDKILDAYHSTTTQAQQEVFLEDFLQAMQKLPRDKQAELRRNVYLIALERIAKASRVLKLSKTVNKKDL